MRHHVGGTHSDGYGHGHGWGPQYTLDLHSSLERYDARKRMKKATRVRRKQEKLAYQKEHHGG